MNDLEKLAAHLHSVWREQLPWSIRMWNPSWFYAGDKRRAAYVELASVIVLCCAIHPKTQPSHFRLFRSKGEDGHRDFQCGRREFMRTKRLMRTAAGALVEKDPQVFPWDGRETFVFETIPKLIGMRPGRSLDFYQYAAFFAGLPDQMRAEFFEADALRFVAAVDALARHATQYSAADKIRPGVVREYLCRYGAIDYRCNAQGGLDWRLADTSRGLTDVGFESQWLLLALEAAEIHMRRNGDSKGLKE